MKPIIPKRLTASRFILLIYFIVLVGLGLPLGLLAIKLNVDYRRKAETVTVKATIPPNPFNTPNYKELYNKPVIIEHVSDVDLVAGSFITIPIILTDPDWVPGLQSIQTRFSSPKPLPSGLKIICQTHKKIKACSLTGTPVQSLNQPQTITITATDALGSNEKSGLTLR